MASKRTKKNEPKSQAGAIRATIMKGATRSVEILDVLLNNEASKSSKFELPPIPPEKLNAIIEMSAHVRPQIEAYVVNVHSRGQTFKPIVDLESEGALKLVADAMYVQKLFAAESAEKPLASVQRPIDSEVTTELESLKRQSLVELAKVTAFFAGCNPDGSFTDLRERTGGDMEATGNAYWEVLRGESGMPRQLIRVRSASIRIGMGVGKEIAVQELRRLTSFSSHTVKVMRTFKRFTQLDMKGQPGIWFKEFGDPRIMSSKTGHYYNSEAAMMAKEKSNVTPAKELYHWHIPSSTPTSYGVPRWVGNIPGVLGSRELDETNLDYFLSNAVPALALLVSGGRFGSGTEEKLKEFFEEEVRGRKSTHKMVILEAESQQRAGMGPTQNPKMQFVPLRDAQVQDALFQEYDKNNAAKIRTSFRLPASLTGMSKFVLAELRFAEDQVFQPLRDDFDSQLDKHFLPAIGVMLWKFKSVATVVRDPDAVGQLTLDAVKAGILVPNEGRRILGELIQEDIQPINKMWANQPMPLTLAILGIKSSPAEAVREQGRQAGDPSPIDTLVAELGIDLGDTSGISAETKKVALYHRFTSGVFLPGTTALGGDDKDDPED